MAIINYICLSQCFLTVKNTSSRMFLVKTKFDLTLSVALLVGIGIGRDVSYSASFYSDGLTKIGRETAP